MIEFEITQENVPAIVGGATFVNLPLVKRMHDVRQEKDILNDDLFTGLGFLPGQYHVQIDHTVRPVVHAPRRVPVSLRDRVIEEVLHMEKLEVITKQMGPAEWSHLRKYVSAWTQKT